MSLALLPLSYAAEREELHQRLEYRIAWDHTPGVEPGEFPLELKNGEPPPRCGCAWLEER